MFLDLFVRYRSSHRPFGLLWTWLYNSWNWVAKVVGIYFELCGSGQCQPQARRHDD